MIKTINLYPLSNVELKSYKLMINVPGTGF